MYVPDICHCSNDTEFFHYPKVFCPMKRHLVTGFLSLWIGFHFPGVCATESHIWILSHSRLPLQRYAVPVSMAPSLLPRAMVTAHCHFFIFHLFLCCAGGGHMDHLPFSLLKTEQTRTPECKPSFSWRRVTGSSFVLIVCLVPNDYFPHLGGSSGLGCVTILLTVQNCCV